MISVVFIFIFVFIFCFYFLVLFSGFLLRSTAGKFTKGHGHFNLGNLKGERTTPMRSRFYGV